MKRTDYLLIQLEKEKPRLDKLLRQVEKKQKKITMMENEVALRIERGK